MQLTRSGSTLNSCDIPGRFALHRLIWSLLFSCAFHVVRRQTTTRPSLGFAWQLFSKLLDSLSLHFAFRRRIVLRFGTLNKRRSVSATTVCLASCNKFPAQKKTFEVFTSSSSFSSRFLRNTKSHLTHIQSNQFHFFFFSFATSLICFKHFFSCPSKNFTVRSVHFMFRFFAHFWLFVIRKHRPKKIQNKKE